MTVSKAQLLKARLPEAEVDVPGVGTVRVRGLSRVEVLAVYQSDTSAPGAFERMMLAAGLVDPELTEEEVGQWQANSPSDDVRPVVDKVAELSGLLQDSAKEAWKEMESDPDAEFRDVPGGAAGDDGGPAA